ncbi:hypothetical protein [Nocardia jiangxiensis]|uniref:Uncharacterized protein n=1 Tax=Nocardia jiangxiensis TaxID=282685 RepID=A0ABW6S9W4_9NOCA|nr:hypothetical protein [Nocardia jiangxiensis]
MIQIDRPFAKADKVDLPAVLAKVGSMDTPGGLVVVGEDIMLRDALLLSVALASDDRFDDALGYEDSSESSTRPGIRAGNSPDTTTVSDRHRGDRPERGARGCLVRLGAVEGVLADAVICCHPSRWFRSRD